ncbi:hypothetical protein ABK040_006871 [Willaertia magna]
MSNMNIPLFLLLTIALLHCLFVSSAVQATSFKINKQLNLNQTIPNNLGINTHFVGSLLDPLPNEMKMILNAGFHWIRDDLTWSTIETSKGFYNYTPIDPFVFNTFKKSNNFRGILIFDYGNPLYDDNLPPFTQTGRNAFANYVVTTMKRYQGLNILFELWNEPNSDWYWYPKANPYNYYLLAKTVFELKEKVVPNEILVGPASTQMGFDFLEIIFQLGVLNYFDAVTVHPYRDDVPETVIPDYKRLKQLIEKYKPKDKDIPMICGEWGYSLLSPNVTNSNNPFDMQGKILSRMFLVNIANEMKVSIWYDWKDDCTNTTYNECWFGAVQQDYFPNSEEYPFIPKSPYIAMKGIYKVLNGYEFKEIIVQENNLFVYRFIEKQNNRDVYVGWHLTSKENQIIRIVKEKKLCYNIIHWNGQKEDGQLCTREVNNQQILFLTLLNGEPTYFQL